QIVAALRHLTQETIVPLNVTVVTSSKDGVPRALRGWGSRLRRLSNVAVAAAAAAGPRSGCVAAARRSGGQRVDDHRRVPEAAGRRVVGRAGPRSVAPARHDRLRGDAVQLSGSHLSDIVDCDSVRSWL